MVWINYRTLGQWVKEKTIELAAIGIVAYNVGAYNARKNNSEAIELFRGMQSSSNYQVMYSIDGQNAFPNLVYTKTVFPLDVDDVNERLDKLVKKTVGDLK